MYSYNGVELPALPSWDTPQYPYAYIVYEDVTFNTYFIDYSKYPQSVVNGRLYVLPFSSDRNYKYEDGVWVETNTTIGGPLIWCNTDTYYNENDENGDLAGTLYLAASDPIPVGSAPDLGPASFMAGLRMGQIVRAMRL